MVSAFDYQLDENWMIYSIFLFHARLEGTSAGLPSIVLRIHPAFGHTHPAARLHVGPTLRRQSPSD